MMFDESSGDAKSLAGEGLVVRRKFAQVGGGEDGEPLGNPGSEPDRPFRPAPLAHRTAGVKAEPERSLARRTRRTDRATERPRWPRPV